MNKHTKRILSLILCGIMMVLTACSGGNKESKEAGKKEKGRYLETKCELPEGAEYTSAIKKLENGTLRVIVQNGIFDSDDDGATWVPVMTELPETEEGSYITGADIDEKGRMLVTKNEKLYLVDESGRVSEIPVQMPQDSGEPMNFIDENGETAEMNNALMGVRFYQDGKIFASDIMGNIYQIDQESGEILKTFGEREYSSDFLVMEDKLITVTMDGMTIYQIESGKVVELDEALNEYFSNSGSNGMYYSSQKLAESDQEDTFYLCDESGLYRYTFGSGEMEQLINGSRCSLSEMNMSFTGVIADKENTFWVMCDTMEAPALYHYKYDAEASAVPRKELTVYSLYGNMNIRQAISKFQSDNTDYQVTLEVGMAGDDAQTVSDALSTLNTNILAGKGPDIILLDGIPVDAYIEKGLLLDLNDTIKELQKDQKFFENILTSQQTEDGIFSVPLRFAVPTVAGTEETLNAVADMESLKEEVKRLGENKGDKVVLGEYTASQFPEMLLYTMADELMTKEGTLDQEALNKFLVDTKEMWQANGLTEMEEDDYEEELREIKISYGDNLLLGSTSNMMSLLSDRLMMSMSLVSGASDFETYLSMNDKYSWGYQIYDGMGEGSFVPIDTVGINAKSNDVEGSKEFIKYMLSESAQSSRHLEGFPVNSEALQKQYEDLAKENMEEMGFMVSTEAAEEGESGANQAFTFAARHATQEEIDLMNKQIESLKTPFKRNELIQETITEETVKYLRGEQEVDQTVEAIMKTVNLYLSE